MLSFTEPTGAPLALVAQDGTPLEAHLWRTEPPRAAVAILGAAATPQRYYRAFASWLAGRGFTVLTFDYRGIGGSRSGQLRGHPATMTEWGTLDVAAALEALRAAAPDVPLFAIGHSFGGQALGLSDVLGTTDGLLTVGAQFGFYGHWDGAARHRMWALWNVAIPTFVATFGYIPGWTGMGEDLPPGVAREWARWGRSERYLLDHVADAETRMRAYSGRTEVWSVTDDDYAPEPAVRAYAAAIGGCGAPVRVISPGRTDGVPIGHFGPFRSRFAGTLWDDMDYVLGTWADG